MPPKNPPSVAKNQTNLFSFFRKAAPSPTGENAGAAPEASEATSSAAPETSQPSSTPTSAVSTPAKTASTPTAKVPSAAVSTPATNSKPAVTTPSVVGSGSGIAETKPVASAATSSSKKKVVDEDEDALFDSDEDTNKRRKIVIPKDKKPKAESKAKATPSKKKGRFDDDDEDEDFEMDEDESEDGDDGSLVDEDDLSDDDDDDEDSFIASDDDSAGYSGSKRRKAPAKGSASKKTKTSSLPPKPPSGSKAKATTTKYTLVSDSNTATPAKGKDTASIMKSSPFTPRSTTSSPSVVGGDSPSTPSSAAALLLPEGVVGQGSHEHNGFEFLRPENRRDANGLRPDHPDYNPRTLKVPATFLKEQTPAMAQWWQFKAQNMDTVLFFKVGKFYELFHMDADIGFAELDLIYMRGSKAHSGFPEVSYGKFASILVSKGYRVARVEQTETPDMLKERNDSAGRGIPKDKVVKRELCAIMTKGTRTYCHLDDLSILEESGQDAVSTSLLICIKEKLSAADANGATEDGGENATLPEYGITCIDTVIGHVTLAQFQDDKQRTRLRAFLARYTPTEVLLEHNGFSEKTLGVVKLLAPKAVIEYLRVSNNEMPSSPNDVIKTLRKGHYFASSGDKQMSEENFLANPPDSWPMVLSAVIRGLVDQSSSLVVLSIGGALWQLRRSLIDYEVLSLGKVFAYIPPDEEVAIINHGNEDDRVTTPMDVTDAEEDDPGYSLPAASSLNAQFHSINQQQDGLVVSGAASGSNDTESGEAALHNAQGRSQKRMVLDEVALSNLEVLVNNFDRTEQGSLWQFVNRCKTFGGKRLLRTWLCAPLFHVNDIQKRQQAVEELLANPTSSTNCGLAQEVEKAKPLMKNIPDLERLLSRVHSNGLKREGHPDSRAIMFEDGIYNMRKIRDFADVLTGFEQVLKVFDCFPKNASSSGSSGKGIKSALLQIALCPSPHTAASSSGSNPNKGKGQFPYHQLQELLQYFREIFDEKQAKKDGNIKPRPGVNTDYDEAMAEVKELTNKFDSYLYEVKKTVGINDLKYFGNGKDRYQIEVPINLIHKLPNDWSSKSQKKTHRRYWNRFIETHLAKLIQAEDRLEASQRDTLRALFAKFDSHRHVWQQASQCLSLLDALMSIASVSALPGYNWPTLYHKEEGRNGNNSPKTVKNVPELKIVAGRHPTLEYTLAQRGEGDYIPNDVRLGGVATVNTALGTSEYVPRCLLLTGPNMGGKSTLLRQTCLIVILAQLGCKVPADECIMTPVDRIFTRVGASDRILAGQSTFFVELAETSLILKAATEVSLENCIVVERQSF